MNTGEWASIGCYLYHSVCRNRTDERSGKKDQVILSHSVAVHREWEKKRRYSSHSNVIQRDWERKWPISFPLWWQKERDGVRECKRTIAREQ